ncbi:MAG: helix-turn-helix transcriptional regulator [Clostridiales bacterium]|nr:helix-turn-helix transcriptional regulator [Clostridiales bacterium]
MLGSRIKELRKKNHLNQDDLAEMIGISRPTLSRWERNEAAPDLEQLRRIADAFGISVSELLEDQESQDKDLDRTEEPKGSEDDNTVPEEQIIPRHDNSAAKVPVLILLALLTIAVLSFVLLVTSSKDKVQTETSDPSTENTTEDNDLIPRSYHKKSERVEFNVDNIQATNARKYIWTVREARLDVQGLAKALMKDVDYYYNSSEQIYCNKGYPEDPGALTDKCCLYPLFSYSSSKPGRTDWRRLYYPADVDTADPLDNWYWLSNYRNYKEFAFGSRSDCRDNVISLLSRYIDSDLTSYDVLTFYLDHTEAGYDKTDLSSDDDYYVFCFIANPWQSISADTADKDSDPGEASIIVIYGSDGIVDVRFQKSIKEFGISEEPVGLMDFDELMLKAMTWCYSKDDDSTYEITRAELILDHDTDSSDYVLRPVWRLEATGTRADYQYRFEMLFDAVTGQFIRTVTIEPAGN